MTDNEIIKALECCDVDDCDNCPNNFGNCINNLCEASIGLINRLQADKEALINGQKTLQKHIAEQKAEIVSRLNARLYAYKTDIFIKGEELMIIPMTDYEEILKEMTEVDKNV